ncbi:methyltransferase domain-containing protein [Candidatus Wolfebacteria bacterium]|nr:methyltransferase domain-containing protein [Candidatus Wolfebacteria bacterium]
MRANVYGVPPNIVAKWVLEVVFPNGVGLWADIACGNGKFTREISVIPQNGIGIDVNTATPILPKNFIFERKKIFDWIQENKERKFDLISSFEFVEHLEKREAIAFIKTIKKMARFVVVSTPSGFLKQDAETDYSLFDNPWQWHRCGFSPKELEELGFAVFILKNAHYKPAGNDKSFDKLIACWGEINLDSVARKIKYNSMCYNFSPIHLYRTIRDNFLRPLF